MLMGIRFDALARSVDKGHGRSLYDDAVPLEMLHRADEADVLVTHFFKGRTHMHQADLFRCAQEGHRFSDGKRRLPRVLPGDNNGVEASVRTATRWQEKARAAAAEKHLLFDQVLSFRIAVRPSADEQVGIPGQPRKSLANLGWKSMAAMQLVRDLKVGEPVLERFEVPVRLLLGRVEE